MLCQALLDERRTDGSLKIWIREASYDLPGLFQGKVPMQVNSIAADRKGKKGKDMQSKGKGNGKGKDENHDGKNKDRTTDLLGRGSGPRRSVHQHTFPNQPPHTVRILPPLASVSSVYGAHAQSARADVSSPEGGRRSRSYLLGKTSRGDRRSSGRHAALETPGVCGLRRSSAACKGVCRKFPTSNGSEGTRSEQQNPRPGRKA